MMNVHDWISTKKAPNNPTAEDMRYGVGCLNDLLVTLSEKMADLLQRDGQHKNYDANDIIEKLEKSTFGNQIKIIKKYCKGFDITFDKMDLLRERRNYFDHNFSTANISHGDAQKLSESINLVSKLIGQLNNANAKADSKIKTSNNIKGDALRKNIIKVVHEIPQDKDGNVPLCEVGSRLIKAGCKYDGKLKNIVAGYGWEIKVSKDEKICFLRVSEVK